MTFLDENISTVLFALTISTAVLLIVSLILIIAMIKLSKKHKAFSKLSGEINIEEILKSNQTKIIELTNHQKHTDQEISKIFENLNRTFEKVAMFKYDAFNGMGGQLSAVIVLLNKNLDGFMLNSIHTREGSHMYTKQIKKGKTEQALSKEEQDTLKTAIAQ